MSAGEGSQFPRIPEDHPLNEAARAVNMVAEERGMEATLEWLGIPGGPGVLFYLAEQRALRAIAAASIGLNMGGDVALDEVAARAIVQTPLWKDMRLLLLGVFADACAIGWKGHELAAPARSDGWRAGEARRDEATTLVGNALTALDDPDGIPDMTAETPLDERVRYAIGNLSGALSILEPDTYGDEGGQR